MEIPVVMTSTYSPDGNNIPLYRQGQIGVMIDIQLNTNKSALCSVILDDGSLIIVGNKSFRIAEAYLQTNF